MFHFDGIIDKHKCESDLPAGAGVVVNRPVPVEAGAVVLEGANKDGAAAVLNKPPAGAAEGATGPPKLKQVNQQVI